MSDFEESIDPNDTNDLRFMLGFLFGRYKKTLDYIDANQVVLEVASGKGYGTSLIAERANHVIAAELSLEYIKHAASKYGANNISILQANLEDSIPVQPESIDVVVSLETIEHLQDHNKFRDSICQSLKPNGLMILSFPNPNTNKNNDNEYHHEINYDEIIDWLSNEFTEYKVYGQGPIVGWLIDLVRGRGVKVGIPKHYPKSKKILDRIPFIDKVGSIITPYLIKSSKHLYITAKK